MHHGLARSIRLGAIVAMLLAFDRPVPAEEPNSSLADELEDKGCQLIRQDGYVISVAIAGAASDADVAKLGGFQELRSVSLAGDGLTLQSVRSIAKIDGVTALGLSLESLDSSWLEAVSDCHQLTSIGISSRSENSFDDMGLAQLSKLRKLVRLSLLGRGISVAAMEQIGELKSLENLELIVGNVPDASLRPIGNLPRLESLLVSSTQLTGAGLRNLETATQLRDLTIWFADIDTAGAQSLANMPALRTLVLVEANVSDEDVELIVENEFLELLSLSGHRLTNYSHRHRPGTPLVSRPSNRMPLPNRITDQSLPSIARSASLRELDLSGTSITDASVVQLARMKSLRKLNVRGTSLTASGVRRLKNALKDTEIAHDEAEQSCR
ncbi:MAG: hypothetical protein DWQ42_14165 [Planctomycetota bacterium]|nr:MAG: hypothetical protein DWQ42_14165 [Planctomycetota bacterium]